MAIMRNPPATPPPSPSGPHLPGLAPQPPRRRRLTRPQLVVCVVLTIGANLGVFGFFAADRPAGAPPAGFSGDVRLPPAAGVWRATGRTTQTAGYLGAREVGKTIVRRWTTRRRCAAGACSFVLQIEHGDGTRLLSPLTQRLDGWHATFSRRFPCRVVDGEQLTWNQRMSFVLRFTAGGRRAEGHQVDLSYAPKCGYGTSRVDWTAALAGSARPLGNDGPVSRVHGPVNGIAETAMAASVGRAVRGDAVAVRVQAADAIGRPVKLDLMDRKVLCRSREHAQAPIGAPFDCLLVATDAVAAQRFVIEIVVTDIEGRCWRGVATAVKRPDGRWIDYDDAAVERVLGRAPLRGCA